MRTVRIGKIGLAVSILLMTMILFPSGLLADGLMVIMPRHHPPRHHPPAHFSFAPMEVKYHRVNVEIDEQVAVTSIDQAFYNPNNRRLEGTYIFPLPEGAHIDKFSMDVNGKMMEAELLDAEKARKLYEEIVRKAKDPALLEYVGRGAFKVRIFPIEPHSTKPIKITYTQVLESDSGLLEYVYPLNTEKFSASPLQDVSIKVKISSDIPIKSVYSPSHHVEIKRRGEKHVVVGFKEKDTRPDSDFKLVFSRHKKDIGIDFMAHRKGNKDGYFMLMISPGEVTDKAKVLEKDICFVLDTSGSMMGKKLRQAQKALAFCLENLNAGDRFEIIRFSTEAEPFFGKLMKAETTTVEKAIDYVNALKPIGGTAIHEALTKAMRSRPSDSNGSRPYHVIFLTDGLPTIGETSEESIVREVSDINGQTRVFSFGIGTDVNTHMLDRIAQKTRAVSQYVLPEEDLELKLSSFYTKISEPVMTDIELKFTRPDIRVSKLYPHELPDLFNGDQLLVFGRYRGIGPSAVKVNGKVNGKNRRIVQDISFPQRERAPFIPAMWATRRIGWLLDEIRIHGESDELKNEITELARRYGVVTPYTAYLIMEDEAIRDVPVPLRNMREFENDHQVQERAGSVYSSLKKEAVDESSRAGAPAVFNSMDVQQLKYSSNRKQMVVARGLQKSQSGAVSKGYLASARGYERQVKVVKGRAFFQNGTIWNDATAQARPNLPQKKIIFNSDDYFDFLGKNTDAAQWMALGRDVDIVVNETLYQIRAE